MYIDKFIKNSVYQLAINCIIDDVENEFFPWFEKKLNFFDNQIDSTFFNKIDNHLHNFKPKQCVNNSLYMHLHHNLPYYEGLAYDKKRGEGYFHAFNIHNNIEVIDSTFFFTKNYAEVKKERWDKLTDWCGVEIPKWFIEEVINKQNSTEIHTPFIYHYYYKYVAKHK